MTMASGQISAFSVAVGQLLELKAAKVGKDGVPTEILILPAGTYTTDDGTFVTSEKVLKAVLAEWKKRGLALPIDYEHQTVSDPPVQAPAAGLITKLELRKEGIVGTAIKWTATAKKYLSAADGEAAEYNFHSPVFWFDKKTREVTRLHSVALTNVPKSHNQKELRAQIAARVDADIRAASAVTTDKGGTMKEFITSLRYALGMRLTDTMKDLRAALEKILAKIPDTEDMIAEARVDADGEATSGEREATSVEGTTMLSLLGLIEAQEVDRLVEARLAERPAAPPEVLTALSLAADTDLAGVLAAVLALKSPAGMVPLAELEAAKAHIAELDEKAGAARIDELVAKNRTRITPALEPEIRTLAATNYELAVATVAKLPEQRPEGVASSPPPASAADDFATQGLTGELAGETVQFDARGAAIKARCEAIMAEKHVSYSEANEIRRNEAARGAA